MRHPVKAALSCADCREWWYDANGVPVMRGPPDNRRILPRPKGTNPPCRSCPKIPLGVEAHWSNAVELDEYGRRLWQFLRECRAVGEFPRDPFVRRAALAAFEAESQARREIETNERQKELGQQLLTLAVRGKG